MLVNTAFLVILHNTHSRTLQVVFLEKRYSTRIDYIFKIPKLDAVRLVGI